MGTLSISLSVTGTTALIATQLFREEIFERPLKAIHFPIDRLISRPPQSSSMQVKRYHRWCEFDNGGSFVPNGEFEGVAADDQVVGELFQSHQLPSPTDKCAQNQLSSTDKSSGPARSLPLILL